MQFGDGSTSRDYTYISDIVDGVIRSLDRPAGFQIYNLGNGNPVRLSTFISLVEESVGQSAKIRVCPEQPGDVPRTCADVTKARVMLGYNPQVSFADGIRTTVKWYQSRLSGSPELLSNGNTEVSVENASMAKNRHQQEQMLMGVSQEAMVRRVRSLSNAGGMTDSHGGAGDWSVATMRPRSMSKPGPELQSMERVRRTVSMRRN